MKSLLAGAQFMIASVTSASADTVWNMPTSVGDSQLVTRMDRWFSEEVRKRTMGALRINVHSNSTLYRMPEILHAVRSGQVQIGEIFLSSYSNENPVFALDNLPFLTVGPDGVRQLYDLQKPVLDEIFKGQGMMHIYSIPFPGQGFFTANELKGINDFKGMKIRIAAPIVAALVKELGGEPVVTEAPEIPQAFMTGMVSAMITGSPAISTKPWEFTKYFYAANAYSSKSAVLVNQAAFDALPKDIQKIVMEVAAETEARGWSTMVEDDAANLKIMQDRGMKVVTPSEDLLKGFRAAGGRVIETWKATAGSQSNAIIDALQKSTP